MKILNTIVFLLLVSTTSAQTNCCCCDKPHKQFDFWVGKWVVTNTQGNKVGESHISKIEKGCVILEHWKGIKGGTGHSMNYYDKSDSTWNQLWVSSSGNILKLKGRFIAGQMVLKSHLIKGRKGTYYNQIRWMPEDDGTVTQIWEVCDKTGKVLRTVFEGIYHRKN